jgi:hypothetical protein
VRGELGLVLADRRVPIVVKRPEDPARVFGPAVLSFLPGAARLAFRLGFRGVALVVPPDGPGAPPPAAWAPKDGPPLPGSSATILQWPRSPLPAYGVGPLLDALRPQVVVVPGEAGRRAARELPELLDVIEVRGARALVPARDGAVTVSTDGTRVEVRTVDRPDPLEEGL